MKVVFLAKRYLPSIGGVERHIQNLSKQLRLQDVEIVVITEKHDANLPDEEVLDGVKVLRIPLQPENNPDIKKSIWGWVRAHKELFLHADKVHVHDVFFWLLPLLPQLTFKKIFMTFHGYEPPGPPNWKQKFWHQFADVATDGNICIGGFHQKWYGVHPDITSYGAVSETVHKLPILKKNRLLFVGRLEQDTSIWAYVQAFAEVYTKNPKLTLDVVGEGPLRAQLESFVKHAQLPVNFLGKQQMNIKNYRDYSVSCVSGYLTILESLAAGVPVLATYGTALKKDYLQLTPFAEWITIASPGKSLEHEMEKMITRQKEVAENAQAWVAEQTWEKLAGEYLSLWQR